MDCMELDSYTSKRMLPNFAKQTLGLSCWAPESLIQVDGKLRNVCVLNTCLYV